MRKKKKRLPPAPHRCLLFACFCLESLQFSPRNASPVEESEEASKFSDHHHCKVHFAWPGRQGKLREGRVCSDNLPSPDGQQFRCRPGGRASLPVSLPRAPCPSRTGSKAGPTAPRTCRLSCVRPTHGHAPLAGHRRGCGSCRPPAWRPFGCFPAGGLPCRRPVFGASRVARTEKCPQRVSQGGPGASRRLLSWRRSLLPESLQARGLCHRPGSGAGAAFLRRPAGLSV